MENKPSYPIIQTIGFISVMYIFLWIVLLGIFAEAPKDSNPGIILKFMQQNLWTVIVSMAVYIISIAIDIKTWYKEKKHYRQSA